MPSISASSVFSIGRHAMKAELVGDALGGAVLVICLIDKFRSNTTSSCLQHASQRRYGIAKRAIPLLRDTGRGGYGCPGRPASAATPVPSIHARPPRDRARVQR